MDYYDSYADIKTITEIYINVYIYRIASPCNGKEMDARDLRKDAEARAVAHVLVCACMVGPSERGSRRKRGDGTGIKVNLIIALWYYDESKSSRSYLRQTFGGASDVTCSFP